MPTTVRAETAPPAPASPPPWRGLVPLLGRLSPAQRVLIALAAAGILLRVLAMLAYWPTIPSNADSRPYAVFAAHDPLGDPQHPAGYSLFLWAFGLITRQVAALTLLQHALGVLTAVLLFAAV